MKKLLFIFTVSIVVVTVYWGASHVNALTFSVVVPDLEIVLDSFHPLGSQLRLFLLLSSFPPNHSLLVLLGQILFVSDTFVQFVPIVIMTTKKHLGSQVEAHWHHSFFKLDNFSFLLNTLMLTFLFLIFLRFEILFCVWYHSQVNVLLKLLSEIALEFLLTLFRLHIHLLIGQLFLWNYPADYQNFFYFFESVGQEDSLA